jgi:hypothetical protein
MQPAHREKTLHQRLSEAIELQQEIAGSKVRRLLRLDRNKNYTELFFRFRDLGDLVPAQISRRNIVAAIGEQCPADLLFDGFDLLQLCIIESGEITEHGRILLFVGLLTPYCLSVTASTGKRYES